jgi:hypothetical protein
MAPPLTYHVTMQVGYEAKLSVYFAFLVSSIPANLLLDRAPALRFLLQFGSSDAGLKPLLF